MNKFTTAAITLMIAFFFTTIFLEALFPTSQKNHTIFFEPKFMSNVAKAENVSIEENALEEHNNSKEHIVMSSTPIPTSEYVWGIDISRYQKDDLTDEYFAMLKQAKCGFIYIQFGISTRKERKLQDLSNIAYAFAEKAEENKIAFGFYFLSEAHLVSERMQEEKFILNFLKEANEKGYNFNSLPLMIDHEVNANEELVITEKRIQRLQELVYSLRKSSIETVVYTSASRYQKLQECLGNDQLFWLADYGGNKTITPPEENPEKLPSFLENENVLIWQYSSNGNLIKERCQDLQISNTISRCDIDRNIMKTEAFIKFLSNDNYHQTQN